VGGGEALGQAARRKGRRRGARAGGELLTAPCRLDANPVSFDIEHTIP
jgi:hypothetical protein